jgi:cyclic lactone autoinducer peptide
MKKFLGAAATIVTAVAMLTVGTACFWFMYQPKTPKCLTK